MTHRNAPLTPEGRRRLIERRLAGESVAVIAQRLRLSRTTVYRWLQRYAAGGEAALDDRSSRPRHCARQTVLGRVAAILDCRRRGWGPHRIGYALQLPRSTVYAVLRRHGQSRLRDRDPQTQQVIRYQRDAPGEVVHLDIKKLGRIPPGGGKRLDPGFALPGSGRQQAGPRPGWDYLHVAIDDTSRLAYVEALPDECGATSAGFMVRACAWFGQAGVPTQRILTDNGAGYRSRAFSNTLEQLGIGHRWTRPYRPQTNGKAERFIQTLLREFAYARPFTSNDQRSQALPVWVDHYNRCRHHSALNGLTPFARVNNLRGKYS